MLIWHYVYENAKLFNQSDFAHVVMLAAYLSALFIAHLMM
jgi:hypothetical protein